mmetsp:Transcript_9380/g.38423  ORF Transcript_9380/g.38423 Transcript_9380/m.38423 type:complete len:267 (+) Transcript_9380:2850-3650(+)
MSIDTTYGGGTFGNGGRLYDPVVYVICRIQSASSLACPSTSYSGLAETGATLVSTGRAPVPPATAASRVTSHSDASAHKLQPRLRAVSSRSRPRWDVSAALDVVAAHTEAHPSRRHRSASRQAKTALSQLRSSVLNCDAIVARTADLRWHLYERSQMAAAVSAARARSAARDASDAPSEPTSTVLSASPMITMAGVTGDPWVTVSRRNRATLMASSTAPSRARPPTLRKQFLASAAHASMQECVRCVQPLSSPGAGSSAPASIGDV